MRGAWLIRTLLIAAVLAVPVAAPAQDRPATTVARDAWITTQVQAKYFVDDLVKGRRIDVDTHTGVVTLSGEVSSNAERQRALTRAREVDGVTRVVDRLKVASEAAGTAGGAGAKPEAAWPNRTEARGGRPADRLGDEISDAWITTKVQSKYYLDTDVKGLQINVSTSGGVVTLAGKVESAAARDKALAIAKSTDGVKQVIDKLAVGKL
ncbi:MAG TPA: BON domain-containing protein [Vicinamibacterales bacterium]|nr:BON domain-containing protein [Vicinamibacterales bacterium]